MKKKKMGLYFILLIVIILSVVAIYFVIDNNIKKSKFLELEEEIINVVKSYYEENPTYLPTDDNFIKEVSISFLEEKRVIALDKFVFYNDVCDNESFIRVVKENDEYLYIPFIECGKMKSLTSSIIPEIILNGESSVYSALESEYFDLGVENVITYNSDDISIDTVMVDTSLVDVTKEGSYYVNYKVYDSNYNLGEISRKVTISKTLYNIVADDLGDENNYSGYVIDNNYLWHSGIMYRIIGIDNTNNSLKLTTANNLINMSYGIDGISYGDSDVNKWLNEEFPKLVSNFENLVIQDSKWCLLNATNMENKVYCEENEYYIAPVGMMDINDYINSYADDYSYLNIIGASHLMNYYDEKTKQYGSLRSFSIVNFGTNIPAGVRPTFFVNDTFLISGSGLESDPYIIEVQEKDSIVSDMENGEYIELSGFIFRKIEEDENGVKFIMNDVVKDEFTEEIISQRYDSNLINGLSDSVLLDEILDENLKYLNNEFINRLDKSKLVLNNYLIEVMDKDYKIIETSDFEDYLTLSVSNQLFNVNLQDKNLSLYDYLVNTKFHYFDDETYSETIDIHYLSFISAKGFYYPMSNDYTYLYTIIRPIITIEKNTNIVSGDGSIELPYKLN